jgi:UDP-glucose 4-epimerase
VGARQAAVEEAAVAEDGEMRAFVTGGAGFIGSSLVDRLLNEGHSVVVFDNFSTGQIRFLENALGWGTFQLVGGNTLDPSALAAAMRGADTVFHLAANADVRLGTEHPRRDLEQNTIATFNVLEAMRTNDIRRITFASTGSIYGESAVIPTPETAPFPVQTSLYGASKLAGEGLIQAYCEGFGFQAWIFRFVSILGERYTHGHVFDFYKSLKADPTRLRVLGNGQQRKSYLYIQDCLDAMLLAMSRAEENVNIFNLGTDEFCEVNDSIGWITERLGIHPVLEYTGGNRGWIGDNPFIYLDTSRIRSLGWIPRLSIKEAVVRTLDYLRVNPALLEMRG